MILLRNWANADGEPDALRAVESFSRWWDNFFSRDSEPSELTAERNVLRHRPLPNGIALRTGPGAVTHANAIARTAAAITGTRLVESSSEHENRQPVHRKLALLGVDRVRLIGAVDNEVRVAADGLDTPVDDPR